MKKAAIILYSVGIAIWLTILIFGIVFGFSSQQGIDQGGEQVDSGGEAIGFVFAAFFLALFSVMGYGAAIISGLFLAFCVFGIIVLAKSKKKGLVVLSGVLGLFGSLPAGIITLVYSKSLTKGAAE